MARRSKTTTSKPRTWRRYGISKRRTTFQRGDSGRYIITISGFEAAEADARQFTHPRTGLQLTEARKAG